MSGGPTAAVRRRAAGLTLAYVLLLVVLMFGSAPRPEGDYLEYVAMALQMADLQGPALTLPELDAIRAELAPFGIPVGVTMSSGHFYFAHFWFYPLLAVPGVALTRALAVHPVYGFALLNLLLLGSAGWTVIRRHHWTIALLVLVSPIVWWIDKAHTEVFTFSLLAIAMTLVSARPGVAMICAGAAATQNPPIAVAVPLIALAATGGDWRRLRERSIWIGAGVGMLLALLHPVYYLVSLGGLTPLGSRGTLPSAQELGAVLWDPNIGLLLAFPLFVVAAIGAVMALAIKAPARLADPGVLVSAALAIVFLLAFAQAPNINSGATPSVSRYALWLIPLALPLLAQAQQLLGQRLVRWTGVLAAVSAVACLSSYRPSVTSTYLQPTRAAAWLWTHWPAVDNPVPEIFAERLAQAERVAAPIALPGCQKVLLVGRGNGPGETQGMWPVPCAPEPVPAECREAGSACYANRSGDRYAFVPVDPRGQYFYEPSPDRVWPPAAESTVREVLAGLSWWQLEPSQYREFSMIRAVHDVAETFTLESDTKLFLTLVRPGSGSVVTLRPPKSMQGGIIDLSAPDIVYPVAYEGEAGAVWNLAIGVSEGFVILYLQ